jgi:hypothetical protein
LPFIILLSSLLISSWWPLVRLLGTSFPFSSSPDFLSKWLYGFSLYSAFQ